MRHPALWLALHPEPGAGESEPPRHRHPKANMEDIKGLNSRKRPGRDPRDESLDELMPGYTPRQREAFLRGLHILAKVAVRARMRRQEVELELGRDGGVEEE